MGTELKYTFTVDENGKVVIQNRDKFLKDLSNFPNTVFTATLKKARRQRSLSQNGFFHGVMLPIIQEHLLDLGWDKAYSIAWVKNYVKVNCLMVEEINEKTGEVIRNVGETSELNTSEFAEFVERVFVWAADPDGLDLLIPAPNQQLEMPIDPDAEHNKTAMVPNNNF